MLKIYLFFIIFYLLMLCSLVIMCYDILILHYEKTHT